MLAKNKSVSSSFRKTTRSKMDLRETKARKYLREKKEKRNWKRRRDREKRGSAGIWA